MQRRDSYTMLVVLGIGVFLAGLELMITAVALPQILATLATWNDLRHASWIINGYLLVYVVTMPLAGRLTDMWGAQRLFLVALAAFTVGSGIAGAAQSLDQLIAGRLVQALGGGAIIPVATAAASHMFEGQERPRALGVIGALTFLGMAAGPFVGAAILEAIHPASVLASFGVTYGTAVDLLAPSWRWVFYLNVPVGLGALVIAWAAGEGWDTPRHPGRPDILGAALFTLSLAGVLGGITLIGSSEPPLNLPLPVVIGGLVATGLGAGAAAVILGLRRQDPFLDPRLFADRVFSSAALISLLTGYGLATAIVGGAVFVDRVLYEGPADQRLVLGALAAATAAGALASGFLVRRLGGRSMTIVGLVAASAGLAWMSTWGPDSPVEWVAVSAALFGAGFGLTVTPRSTAAVESAGRRAFGAASATVTVARMIGMAVGMAILTAYGSTRIEELTRQIYQEGMWRQILPAYLQGRTLEDGQVVDWLERWAAQTAGGILVGVFLAAAAVTLLAVVPAVAMRVRPGMLGRPGEQAAGIETSRNRDVSEPIAF